MSTSRRRFLKASAFAAMFAAVPLTDTLAKTWKANYVEDPQDDALSNYSKATFESYLQSIFQLHATSGIVEVTLVEVGDLPGSSGGECFSLQFRGGSQPLKQGSYQLDHAALGSFTLLLVPSGSDSNGAQGYVATINRLSYADALNNPPPQRIRH